MQFITEQRQSTSHPIASCLRIRIRVSQTLKQIEREVPLPAGKYGERNQNRRTREANKEK